MHLRSLLFYFILLPALTVISSLLGVVGALRFGACFVRWTCSLLSSLSLPCLFFRLLVTSRCGCKSIYSGQAFRLLSHNPSKVYQCSGTRRVSQE
ncbi:hypothetical protein B0H10DRAFT_6992 [Mycena sp. CBHHK59/15]|nr:hypothetical protein B0H10DRAFT_6992 [Mycena sp. CBHHK59/15]